MVENLIQNFTHEGRYIQANQNISTSLFYTQTLNLSGEAVAVFKISTKDYSNEDLNKSFLIWSLKFCDQKNLPPNA